MRAGRGRAGRGGRARTCTRRSAGRAPSSGAPRAARRRAGPSSRPRPSRSAARASGSVASSAGSMTVRTGQWKAPTRFLPSGRSIAVLPPIAASTWPTSVVGTATQSTPRRYVAAAKPARSVGRAAAERDDRPAAVEPRAQRQSRVEVVGRLAGRTSWVDASRGPSASCASAPWMPATCASATSATGPSPGRARRAARASRPRRGRPAAARTTSSTSRASASATSRVERLPLLVQRPERASSCASGRPLSAHPLPRQRRRRPRRRPSTRARARPARIARLVDRAAAERDHGRLAPCSASSAAACSSTRNSASPRCGEDLGDRAPALSSISRSTSTNRRPSRSATSAPSVDLPAPMKPTSARCFVQRACQSMRSR